MLSPRADAQSIVIKRGTWPNKLVETLWIIGGRNGTFWENDNRFYTTHDWMNTTEFHTFGKEPEYGPDLPDFMNGFCAAKIDDHRVIIMGGKYRATPRATFSKKVWIYNFQDPNYAWRPKEDMRYEREGQFGCTSYKDSSFYDNRTMVMAIGGHPNPYVELYDVENRKWGYGKFAGWKQQLRAVASPARNFCFILSEIIFSGVFSKMFYITTYQVFILLNLQLGLNSK